MVNLNDLPKIFALSPEELWKWLDANFNRTLPCPATSQEFAAHKHLLGELTNTYSFLNSLLAYAGIQVRNAQRAKNKELLDDCRSRRDTIELFAKNALQQYNAFSRMMTAQKQADEELRMLGEG